MTRAADRNRKPVGGGGMSTAESLLRRLRQSEGLNREFLFGKIARDYGEGFALVVREKFEASERKRSGTSE